MTAYDRIGRRKRTTRTSTGKRIILQERDLLWFRTLREHGPLPSSYLLSFCKRTHASDTRSLERLTDLFNEEDTKHGGAYLSRPVQQFHTLDSRYNQLVYDLTPAAHRALADAGDTDSPSVRSGPWLHSFMVACITASVALAVAERPDLSFLNQSRLLARSGAELRYPVRIADPAGGESKRKDLIPDALFGLAYRSEEGTRYRCFLVEADRSTEPAVSGNFNRKSWERSFRQYEAYIGSGLYREHLALRAPLLLLTVVTDTRRLMQLLHLVEDLDLSIRPQVLLQPWGAFSTPFSPPTPNPALLGAPWLRAGLPAFRIDGV